MKSKMLKMCLIMSVACLSAINANAQAQFKSDGNGGWEVDDQSNSTIGRIVPSGDGYEIDDASNSSIGRIVPSGDGYEVDDASNSTIGHVTSSEIDDASNSKVADVDGNPVTAAAAYFFFK